MFGDYGVAAAAPAAACAAPAARVVEAAKENPAPARAAKAASLKSSWDAPVEVLAPRSAPAPAAAAAAPMAMAGAPVSSNKFASGANPNAGNFIS